MNLLIVAVILLICLRRARKRRSRLVLKPMGRGFDYTRVYPEVFRPFNKPNKVYRWSMALSYLDPNQLFIIDNQYMSLIKIRNRVITEFPELSIGYDESCEFAIHELYKFVIDYLTARYPYQFKKRYKYIQNTFDGVKLPIDTTECSPNQLLRYMATLITEDLMILLPNDDGEFYLKGYISCAPGGLDITTRMNHPLSWIHDPVTGLNDRIGFAMKKFFKRLPSGEFMVRNNWFIQYTDPPKWFYFVGETIEHYQHPLNCDTFQLNEKGNLKLSKLDFNLVFLRTEKQSFIKLPKSGALIMAVKTHLTPLNRVRDEEKLGLELSDAIDGIKGEARDYKGVDYWANAMKSYLKGDTDGITSETYDYTFEY